MTITEKLYRELRRIVTQVTDYFPYVLIWHWKKYFKETSSIAVYLSLPMHYAIFENIHRHLPEVILVAGNQRTAQYLDQRNISYTRERLYPEAVIMADYLQHKYPVKGIKKIQIFHGVGCKNYFYGKISSDQFCLVPGPSWAEKLKVYGINDLEVVGYAKTDDLFSGLWNKEALLRDIGGDINKKTVLYAPTWGKISSAKQLQEVISRLTARFNVLVKLHDNSPDKWQQIYRDIPGIIYCQEVDATKYLYVADILISDFSSIVFEFAQLYRPIIVFGVSDEYLQINAPDPPWWDIANRLVNTEDVEPMVVTLLDETWQPDAKYKKIVDAVFGYRDGNSGKRGAEIIRSIVTTGKGCRYGSDHSSSRFGQ